MRQRLLIASGLILLVLSTTFVIWQGSFTFGGYGPTDINQTFLFWAISTVVFLLTLTLGFLLLRTALKLYLERKSSGEGSRIKTKLVAGAIGLTVLPGIFLVLFSISVLNYNLDKWFSRPGEGIKQHLIAIGVALDREAAERAMTQARLLANHEGVRAAMRQGVDASRLLAPLCEEFRIPAAAIANANDQALGSCGDPDQLTPVAGKRAIARISASQGERTLGFVSVATGLPMDLAQEQSEIVRYLRDYDQLAIDRRAWRAFYLQLMSLLTLFVLFIAIWVALLLAKQISTPIAALLHAAGEVRKGNLQYRVKIPANDELAALVSGFNEMTQDLEASAQELERRRRFMETILESIPTAVLSVASDGSIQRMNSAFRQMFPKVSHEGAKRLEDVFAAEDASEMRYLMARASRTAVASRQWEHVHDGAIHNISITVAAIDRKPRTGFVVVLEDTTELLRAQKAAAWHEVARRVAHEIKNPLTPISLSADRIRRKIDRANLDDASARVIRECAEMIGREADSVRMLVDEFAQFARMPSAQLRPIELNDVVEDALRVFHGRLADIDVHVQLTPGLPRVEADPEQFKRVIVNLVDNAVEAMAESAAKRISVATAALPGGRVELTIADTGCGVSDDDKAKLFVPYYSTKGRGSGLGLAIVNHILEDHQAAIRVEDNQTVGTRFVIELAAHQPDVEPRTAEASHA
ncbi:MAG: ATP-binding protein [Bryobacterales bacterium]|jgi:PAS domain S-box-containing protein|nr:ATP-binding protein [Bryobacterales bacterium]